MSSILKLTVWLPLLVWMPSVFAEEAEPEFEWFFTLAVEQEGKNFSISLMREGWVSFDTWDETGEFREQRINLPMKEFEAWKQRFETLFLAMEKDKDLPKGPAPSFMFERVTDHVRTIEFTGRHQRVVDQLSGWAVQHGLRFPFPVE